MPPPLPPPPHSTSSTPSNTTRGTPPPPSSFPSGLQPISSADEQQRASRRVSRTDLDFEAALKGSGTFVLKESDISLLGADALPTPPQPSRTMQQPPQSRRSNTQPSRSKGGSSMLSHSHTSKPLPSSPPPSAYAQSPTMLSYDSSNSTMRPPNTPTIVPPSPTPMSTLSAASSAGAVEAVSPGPGRGAMLQSFGDPFGTPQRNGSNGMNGNGQGSVYEQHDYHDYNNNNNSNNNRRSIYRAPGSASSPDLATLVRKAKERAGKKERELPLPPSSSGSGSGLGSGSGSGQASSHGMASSSSAGLGSASTSAQDSSPRMGPGRPRSSTSSATNTPLKAKTRLEPNRGSPATQDWIHAGSTGPHDGGAPFGVSRHFVSLSCLFLCLLVLTYRSIDFITNEQTMFHILQQPKSMRQKTSTFLSKMFGGQGTVRERSVSTRIPSTLPVPYVNFMCLSPY
jgi:hypothetical protein